MTRTVVWSMEIHSDFCKCLPNARGKTDTEKGEMWETHFLFLRFVCLLTQTHTSFPKIRTIQLQSFLYSILLLKYCDLKYSHGHEWWSRYTTYQNHNGCCFTLFGIHGRYCTRDIVYHRGCVIFAANCVTAGV